MLVLSWGTYVASANASSNCHQPLAQHFHAEVWQAAHLSLVFKSASILPLVSQSNQRCGKLRSISPCRTPSFPPPVSLLPSRHSREASSAAGLSDFKSFIKPSTHLSSSFPLSGFTEALRNRQLLQALTRHRRMLSVTSQHSVRSLRAPAAQLGNGKNDPDVRPNTPHHCFVHLLLQLSTNEAALIFATTPRTTSPCTSCSGRA